MLERCLGCAEANRIGKIFYTPEVSYVCEPQDVISCRGRTFSQDPTNRSVMHTDIEKITRQVYLFYIKWQT